jgi:hypothetical protein
VSIGWAFIAAVFITALPLINEVVAIRKVIRTKRVVDTLADPSLPRNGNRNENPSTSGETKKNNAGSVSAQSIQNIGHYDNIAMSDGSAGANLTPVFP